MNRVARMCHGLSKRHNDTLTQVDAAVLAQKFNLPAHFVERCIADEIKRRAAA